MIENIKNLVAADVDIDYTIPVFGGMRFAMEALMEYDYKSFTGYLVEAVKIGNMYDLDSNFIIQKFFDYCFASAIK